MDKEKEKKRDGVPPQVDQRQLLKLKFLVPGEIEQELTQLRNADKIIVEIPIWRSRYGPVEPSSDISEAHDPGVLSQVDIIRQFLACCWPTEAPQKLAWLLTR
ncbi:hypothetical protein N7541_011737 [Penicillium brevicompactum]|uniref:Uncharacterized protein n=1 Tax=Penicillium brevicompactum TaxID=5074 RepID=A0A9W9QR53_PENBR|nr:hypothetical protein N7541_011737 [Penicillium brevicompactum]